MIRGQEEGTYALRISSLILHSVGQLLPHQIATGKFHTRDFIYPVSYLLTQVINVRTSFYITVL